MAQELWLSEKQLPTLQQLGTQFVARSGMEDAVSSGIMVGRPFGGVSISWSHDLDPRVSPLSNYRHKRVVGLEMRGSENDILIICTYMPFYNASRRAECMAETIDAITMIETLISDHPNHAIIIGGDTNTEMKGTSPFDPLWQNLMSRFQLVSCDRMFPHDSITYRHDSLGQHKWNDHFIVSKLLMENDSLSHHAIPDDGDNTSDHLPIIMALTSRMSTASVRADTPSELKSALKWEKMDDSQKNAYTQKLSYLTNSF